MKTNAQPPILIGSEELARVWGRDARTVRSALARSGITPDAIAIAGTRQTPLFASARIPDLLKALCVSIEPNNQNGS